MDNFKVEKVFIGDKVIDEITDENGIRWYPLKKFVQSILCKYEKVGKFRDTTLNKQMKVIEYLANPRHPDTPVKTWCMNEKGIRYLLKNMDIHQKGKININLYRAREKGFFEACMYFKIRPLDKLDPLYINVAPKLTNYDVWSILCIENDLKLKAHSRWKKCSECNYYYPDKTRYFGSTNKKTAKMCLQCQGKNFECQNKIIQYIYNHDGYDLLYNLSLNNDARTVESLRKFINKGGMYKDES